MSWMKRVGASTQSIAMSCVSQSSGKTGISQKGTITFEFGDQGNPGMLPQHEPLEIPLD